ncbi:motility protein A [Caproiciproducens sp. NJN-50]|uniref:motility protein A n=1 Tax=Acutalibacteraceae TaxID=3082771 RepID=UPI000FFE1A2F|nr:MULTISPECIES: MotA/TolQ/ExbB proton channel family protein [Acutalibacteraceae]QAT50683.1 motility protein A [Caproiciproducens sp. NJN-50]
MDFTGIIGLIAGLGLIFFGITNFTDMSAMKGFIDYQSMAITFGGTIASTLIAFPISYFKKIPAQLKITLQRNRYDPQKYIGLIVEFAQEARKKGLLSLEEKANALDDSDSFLKNSILLIVDAIDPEKVKEMLDNELDSLDERHAAGWQFFEKASTFAPAFGMIGTLIGLINMLGNLNMDSSSGASALGQGMSVALVTTFYGSLAANLILVPIGHKLHMRHNEERLCKEIVVEGVIAIQAGDNPKHIEQRLNAFLCEKQRGEDQETGKKPKKEKKSKK